MRRNKTARLNAMQTLLQRWKRNRCFAALVNTALLFALLALCGGEPAAPREALADDAVAEVLTEAGELAGGATDSADGDAEAVLFAALALRFVSPLEPHPLRAVALPCPRQAWRTPAARAPPTLA
ncbi:MAG: hypothetical protein RLW61_21095 [Gammaproteobacteria bacterium]